MSALRMNIIRAKRELKNCSVLQKVSIEIVDENILNWKIIINPNTDIFKEGYEFLLDIPNGYPFDAPKIKCLSKVFHPNIDKDGKVCLARLNEWITSYTIESLLTDIIEIFENPNLDDPVNLKAAKLWGKKEYLEWM